MKTTKKGFTLIELIVVIAIIGVLAAILVPTMLGYVRKSKLSSAGTTASSIYKAINSTLTELDEEGYEVGGNYTLTWTGTGTTPGWAADLAGITDSTGAAVTGDKTGAFHKKIANFFADIDKVKSAKAAVYNGNCVALACCSDKTYTGTYPSGVITNENYDSTDFKPATGPEVQDKAVVEALKKAGIMAGTNDPDFGAPENWTRG